MVFVSVSVSRVLVCKTHRQCCPYINTYCILFGDGEWERMTSFSVIKFHLEWFNSNVKITRFSIRTNANPIFQNLFDVNESISREDWNWSFLLLTMKKMFDAISCGKFIFGDKHEYLHRNLSKFRFACVCESISVQTQCTGTQFEHFTQIFQYICTYIRTHSHSTYKTCLHSWE